MDCPPAYTYYDTVLIMSLTLIIVYTSMYPSMLHIDHVQSLQTYADNIVRV